MKKLDAEYPTETQVKEMWEALEGGDDRAILAVLQKRQEEVRVRNNSIDKPDGIRQVQRADR